MNRVLTILMCAVVGVVFTAATASAQDEKKKEKKAKGPVAEKLMKRLDADSDGKLTEAEYLKISKKDDAETLERIKKRFTKVDGDGDGSVTLAELTASMAKKPKADKAAEGDKPKKAKKPKKKKDGDAAQ
jgi:Ca2+-binding EF-hand superfamily protein